MGQEINAILYEKNAVLSQKSFIKNVSITGQLSFRFLHKQLIFQHHKYFK